MSDLPQSLCVLRLSALGDCINAYGLICALKKKYPALDISWLIDKRFSSLFIKDNGEPLVNMITTDIKTDGVIKSLKKLRDEYKDQRFDILFNMQTSIKASILSLGIKAKLKYGYDDERRRECQGLFINRKINKPHSPHVLSGFLSFANSAGFEIEEPVWDFALSKNELDKAASLLELPDDKKILTISPASAKAVKNWTVKGYSSVAKYAMANGFKIVLVGSPNETEMQLCKEIEEDLAGKCINLCGRTSLRILCAVLKLSSLVLSPDSASMHLSSALNVPVIGLFAIHNPVRVGAYNFKNLYVSVYEELSRGELLGKAPSWRYRVKNEKAMQSIKIESVIAVFDKARAVYDL